MTLAAGLSKSIPEVKSVAVLIDWHDSIAPATSASVLFSEHPDRIDMLTGLLQRASAFEQAILSQLQEAIQKERIAHEQPHPNA